MRLKGINLKKEDTNPVSWQYGKNIHYEEQENMG